MATKRKLVIRNPEVTEEEEPPQSSQGPWFKRIYAKYWYVLSCIVIITMVPLEILRHGEWGDVRYSVSLIFFGGALVLFAIGFLKLWGRGGVWVEE